MRPRLHAAVLLIFLLAYDNCGEEWVCPLSNLASSEAIIEYAIEERQSPKHGVQVQRSENGEYEFSYQFENAQKQSTKEVYKISASQYNELVHATLTLYKDDACEDLRLIHKDKSMTHSEKREQMKTVRSKYVESCLEVLWKHAKAKVHKIPTVSKARKPQCPEGLNEIQSDHFVLSLGDWSTQASLILHFEPLYPLSASQSHDNYGIQRAYRYRASRTVQINRLEVPTGLQKKALKVTVAFSKPGEGEEVYCRFEWPVESILQ